MFIDEIKIYARAGHGGKGCIAFVREAYRPKGGPSGGNGGRGGDVILEASHDLNNLIAQFYNSRLVAENGEGGMGKGMDGHAGKDLIIKVPCGTLVWKVALQVESVEDIPALAEDVPEEDEAPPESPKTFKLATGTRPVLRHAEGARALEIDLRA